MTEKQATWRPTTAKKPPHLTLSTSPEQRADSLAAALKGATVAFASTPVTTPGESPQAKGDAGHGTIGGNTPWESNDGEGKSLYRAGSRRMSPPRGRYLSPQDATMSRVTRQPPGQTNHSPHPVLSGTSSTIAARVASANTSPVRKGVSKSPRRELRQQTAKEEPQNLQPQNMSSTTGPQRVKPVSSPNFESGEPDNRKQLNLGRTPSLSPVKATSVSDGAARGKVHGRSNDSVPFQSSPSTGTTNVNHSDFVTAGRPIDPDLLGSKRSQSVKNSPVVSRYGTPESIEGHYRPAVPVPRRQKVHLQLQRTNTGTQVMDAKTRQDTIERMADAMVASSLASRRPISPAKVQSGRAYLSRRRSASVHDIYRIHPRAEEVKGPPTKPPRPLKTTLRKHSSENSGDEFEPQKRGRRHLVRKHPHKYREGDRKRWRDKITESERRRYEGVYAANRGRLLESVDSLASPTQLVDLNADSNMVVNVVVRDVWERSRLPSHTLREIYDLVAPDSPQKLNREQFVVGLWLIDQALKGKKLPVRVSDHVWASVRHSQGIKYKPHKPIT